MKRKPVIPRKQAHLDTQSILDYYLAEVDQKTASGFVDALEKAYAHLSRRPPSEFLFGLMNNLLSIRTRADACHSPEGAGEVRLVAVSQMMRNISCSHVEVLQHFAGGSEARVAEYLKTYKRHRFPPDIISYAVWLYYRLAFLAQTAEKVH